MLPQRGVCSAFARSLCSAALPSTLRITSVRSAARVTARATPSRRVSVGSLRHARTFAGKPPAPSRSPHVQQQQTDAVPKDKGASSSEASQRPSAASTAPSSSNATSNTTPAKAAVSSTVAAGTAAPSTGKGAPSTAPSKSSPTPASTNAGSKTNEGKQDSKSGGAGKWAALALLAGGAGAVIMADDESSIDQQLQQHAPAVYSYVTSVRAMLGRGKPAYLEEKSPVKPVEKAVDVLFNPPGTEDDSGESELPAHYRDVQDSTEIDGVLDEIGVDVIEKSTGAESAVDEASADHFTHESTSAAASHTEPVEPAVECEPVEATPQSESVTIPEVEAPQTRTAEWSLEQSESAEEAIRKAISKAKPSPEEMEKYNSILSIVESLNKGAKELFVGLSEAGHKVQFPLEPQAEADSGVSLEQMKNYAADLKETLKSVQHEQWQLSESAVQTIKEMARQTEAIAELYTATIDAVNQDLEQRYHNAMRDLIVAERENVKGIVEAEKSAAEHAAAQQVQQHKEQLESEMTVLRQVMTEELRTLTDRVYAFERIFEWQNEQLVVGHKTTQLTSALLDVEAKINSQSQHHLLKEWNTFQVYGREDDLVMAAVQSVPSAVVKTGVVTVRDLQAQFRTVQRKLLEGALVPPNASVWGHLLAKATSLLLVRERPEAEFRLQSSNTDHGRIARADLLVQRGDLRGAVQLLEQSSPLVRELSATWVEDCRRRLLLEQAVDILKAHTTCVQAQWK